MWKEKRTVVENFLDRNKLFVLTAHSWPPCGRDNDGDFDDDNSIYDDHFDDRDDDDDVDVDLAKCRLPWANLRMRYTTIISIDTDTFASAVILCCLE